MAHSADILKTLAQKTASQITQKPCSEAVKGQPEQTGIFQKKKKKTDETSKDYC